MSRILELPDGLYDALLQVAAENGTTPQDWIAAQLPPSPVAAPVDGPKTLAELFAGRVGRIRSGGQEIRSENGGDKLTEHLRRKRAEGNL